MLTLTVLFAAIAMLFFVGFLLSFRSASSSDRLKPRTRSFILLTARRAAGVYVRDERPATTRRRFRRRRRQVVTIDPLQTQALPATGDGTPTAGGTPLSSG